MRIEVTQEMIDSGEPKSECGCAIALAVLVHLPSGCTVAVTDCAVEVLREQTRLAKMSLPHKARDFINDFDAGRPVTPFSFPLPLEELVGGGE